jgi:hypothetical protein
MSDSFAETDCDTLLVCWVGSNDLSADLRRSSISADTAQNIQQHGHVMATYDPHDKDSSGNPRLYPAHIWHMKTDKKTLKRAEAELRLAINSHPWSEKMCPLYDAKYCAACEFLKNQGNSDSSDSVELESRPAVPSLPTKTSKRPCMKPVAHVITSVANNHRETLTLPQQLLHLVSWTIVTLQRPKNPKLIGYAKLTKPLAKSR